MKVYRTQHTIITPDQFVGFDTNTNTRVDPWAPYNPALYMSYYQGEFDPAGNLKDPQAPCCTGWSRSSRTTPRR